MLGDMTEKSALRRIKRIERNEYFEKLTASDIKVAFSNAPSPLRYLISNAKTVSGYWPAASEADPRMLLKFANECNCTTALPYIAHPSAPMQFLEWRQADPVEIGAYGMHQPQSTATKVTPDIVLAPLVAFDRQGGRIGQGGGHYDRAFSLLDNAIKIGIAWSVQELNDTSADPWDIPLDYILTEREWIEI
jgi:5-formyltetrahydrofolate cyclo-ligase